MNHSKFSLADLLTVLGAIIFGFFCFLSFNFLSMGKTVPSIGRAATLTFLLGGFAFIVKLLKIRSRNFKAGVIWEWVCLVLFTIIACLSVVPFSHYFAVLQQKEEIRNKVTVDIELAKGMFTHYEDYAKNREAIYKSRLDGVVRGKYRNPNQYYHDYGFVEGRSDSVQIDNKTFTLHAQLFPTNYEGANGMKQLATNWLNNAESTLEDKWKFTFGVVDVVNKLQTNVSNWKGDLEKYSKFRATGEQAENHEFTLAFNDITDKITQLGTPGVYATAFAFILYILMLLSYVLTKRHSKSQYTLFSFISTKKDKKSSGDIDIDY